MKKNNITISYCIPVCNEHEELYTLLTQLNDFVGLDDQIVIQYDKGNTTEAVKRIVKEFTPKSRCELTVVEFALDGDFSAFKNNLKSQCTKDYVFQIDADEYLGDGLLMNLPNLLAENPETDLFYLPRINIVTGLTYDYAKSQNWFVQKIDFPIAKEYNSNVINFPDRQARLMRNKPEIHWQNKVHEVIVGHTSYTDMSLPVTNEVDLQAIQDWCLIHIKAIDRQKRQNEMYRQIALQQKYE